MDDLIGTDQAVFSEVKVLLCERCFIAFEDEDKYNQHGCLRADTYADNQPDSDNTYVDNKPDNDLEHQPQTLVGDQSENREVSPIINNKVESGSSIYNQVTDKAGTKPVIRPSINHVSSDRPKVIYCQSNSVNTDIAKVVSKTYAIRVKTDTKESLKKVETMNRMKTNFDSIQKPNITAQGQINFARNNGTNKTFRVKVVGLKSLKNKTVTTPDTITVNTDRCYSHKTKMAKTHTIGKGPSESCNKKNSEVNMTGENFASLAKRLMGEGANEAIPIKVKDEPQDEITQDTASLCASEKEVKEICVVANSALSVKQLKEISAIVKKRTGCQAMVKVKILDKISNQSMQAHAIKNKTNVRIRNMQIINPNTNSVPISSKQNSKVKIHVFDKNSTAQTFSRQRFSPQVDKVRKNNEVIVKEIFRDCPADSRLSLNWNRGHDGYAPKQFRHFNQHQPNSTTVTPEVDSHGNENEETGTVNYPVSNGAVVESQVKTNEATVDLDSYKILNPKLENGQEDTITDIKDLLGVHEEGICEGFIYRCLNCLHAFEDEHEFKAHKLLCGTGASVEVKTETLKCAVCSKAFDDEALWKIHVDKCSVEQYNREHIENNIDIPREFLDALSNDEKESYTVKQKRNNFTCGMCNKNFRGRFWLKRHMIIHSEQKDYVCTICNKGFSYKHGLKTHMNIHSDERKYKCNICEADYKHFSNLEKHKKTHKDPAEVRKFKCHICDMGFYENYHLRRHLDSHIPVRNVQCELCDLAFQRADSLRTHMKRVHSSDRNPLKRKWARTLLKCPVCDQVFSMRKVLLRHMQMLHPGVETNIAPIKSSLDDGESDNNDGDVVLDDDEQLDSEDEYKALESVKKKGELKCNDCDRVFRSEGNFKRHMRVMHDEESE
ncbi:zinc finger protein OBI1-like [Mya arenaria]|uniref:zinc finger protein OBI1-like n=1 Tax=Mya arenaria TaxID=6604 RepID=UPI0022DEAA81|nr:zinc finger protein OBI1-like [Mya arenaria]